MTKEESRKAMLRTRAYVRNFTMRNKNPDKLDNLSQYPKNISEARRTIIALQDLLEANTERHKKASDNVVLYKGENLKHYRMVITLSKRINLMVSMLKRTSDIADKEIKALRKANEDLSYTVSQQNVAFEIENNKKHAIASALKDALNGEI